MRTFPKPYDIPSHISDLITYLDGVDAEFYEKAQRLRNTGFYKKLRKEFFKLNPFCEMCMDRGVSTFAVEFDHIVPARRKSLGDFFDMENFQGLCVECHQYKTIEDRSDETTDKFAPDESIRITEDGEVVYNGK